jgi:DNA-directed RNA polymerase specialized sigma subunit
MASEYLNNKKLEKVIVSFQKIKRSKNMYQYLMNNIKEQGVKEKEPDSWVFVKNEYNRALNDYDITQRDLATAFYTLSENIVRYAKFNLIDPDDSVQEGVLICFEKLDRFDPRFGKAFNYMTTCILNHFKQLYRSARNYTELKKKYQDHMSRELQNEINVSKTHKPRD